MKPQRIVSLQPDEPEIPVEIQELDDEDRRDFDSGHHAIEASYLPDPALGQAGLRWQQIQAEFVDDPRKSVADAHALVDDLVNRIVQEFTNERANLEGQWSRGEEVSTEDLRVCLQRYRSFFTRILPSVSPTR